MSLTLFQADLDILSFKTWVEHEQTSGKNVYSRLPADLQVVIDRFLLEMRFAEVLHELLIVCFQRRIRKWLVEECISGLPLVALPMHLTQIEFRFEFSAPIPWEALLLEYQLLGRSQGVSQMNDFPLLIDRGKLDMIDVIEENGLKNGDKNQ